MAHKTAQSAGSRPLKETTNVVLSTSPDAKVQRRTAEAAKPNSHLGSPVAPVTVEARRLMIAEAAYYLAERRGFADGHDTEDWLLAEKQIDASIAGESAGSRTP